MHHIDIPGGYSANFNSDFSGHIEIISPTGEHFGIPMNVFEAVVAEKIKRAIVNWTEGVGDWELIYGGNRQWPRP